MLVAKGFEPSPQRFQRTGDGLRGRCQKFAQYECRQVPLAVGKCIAIRALQECGDRFIKTVLGVTSGSNLTLETRRARRNVLK
jgi:hypothetical protein